MYKKFIQILLNIKSLLIQTVRHYKRIKRNFSGIGKRQRFILISVSSSLILFSVGFLLRSPSLYIAFFLGFFTIIPFFISVYKDLRNNFPPQVFILPFFYSLSFGLFYFLVPERIITRIALSVLYGFGLYSLFLSMNIFIVSTIRTIALVSSARTVSFIVTILSYFFIANVVFSMHLNIFLTLLLVFIFSFPFVLYSLWTHSLDSKFFSNLLWVLTISACLVEISLILWFWPASPTVIALFLTGFFYITVGISQVWLQMRLFKSIMWEYVWVGVLVFTLFIVFAFKE